MSPAEAREVSVLRQQLRSSEFRLHVGQCLELDLPPRVHEKLLKAIVSQRVGSATEPATAKERHTMETALESLVGAYCEGSGPPASLLDVDPEYRDEICLLIRKTLEVNQST